METSSVLVTGAASGIGLRCAQDLTAEGNQVVASDLREDALHAAHLDRADNLLLVSGDVGDAADCQRVVAQAVERFGRLDALIHFAGIHSKLRWDELTAEEFTQVLHVNVTGSFLMAQAAARPMIERGSGSIVLTASGIVNIGGVGGGSGRGGPAYASSKGGVVALMRSLARSLGPYGIRANAISPGSTDTPMTAEYTEASRQGVRERSLLGRMGQPKDISDVARFLTTEAARYITEEIINVNGGTIMA